MSLSIDLNLNVDNGFNNLNQNIITLEKIEDETTLKQKRLKEIYEILNNNDLKVVCKNILTQKYVKKFSYEDLNAFYEVIESLHSNLSKVKDMIDIEVFFDKGQLVDIQGLKKVYYELGRNKIFPNFDFKRLKELIENPITELKPFDYKTEELMVFDPFVVRKYLYAIIQMVVNEMDLLVGFVGKEGVGKSNAVSQDIALVYYLLKELKLINYEYDIKEIFFNSLADFIATEDKYYGVPFRILALDEGNELNRQDWQDERVKTFFQRLRRERKEQRIKFICLPQLGELMTSIVLSRMNFIFKLYSKDHIQTKTLKKGYCNFYIVPRGDYIYSPAQKREIKSSEVIDTLGSSLEDKKKYLKDIPSNLIIKRFKRNYIWGFNKKDYDKYLKESNKTFSVAKGVRITEYQAYIYFKTAPPLKEWGLNYKEDSEMYGMLSKMDRAIKKIFENDPDKLMKYELMMKNKKERKEARK